MSSKLWPNNDNKDLIIGIANYLQDLLNQNKSKLDEVSIDSLTVATESLQTIISPEDDTLPKSSFSLQDVYQSYLASNKNDDEKKQSSSTSASSSKSSSKPLPSNIQKRREKFLEFIKVLQKHDFFKGCPEGSEAYQQRMEKARTQYNTRFATMSIDSLDWLEDGGNTQSQKPTPMDTDNDNDSNRVITEDDKKEAERLKGEGNKLLGKKQYSQAVEKYTQAIKRNPNNAVYFSNRAAAYTYLKQYNQAVQDSQSASKLDPDYVKAYVREGLAEYEMGNYQNALDAYQKALNKTKSTDKAWETYMEKVQLCQQKLDEENGVNDTNDMGDMGANPFAGLGGGAGGGGPDLSQLGNLLGGLGGGGGAGGAGGLDFGKLMQNPMMQQMAQQMMQDPNAMKKMADMMGNMGGGAPAAGANDGGGGGDADVDVNQAMADLLQNPEKAQGVFQQAMSDPEVKELMKEDPAIEPLINRIKTGDYGAFMELGSKPKAMAKVKGLIQKYYKK
mmetsp:Transcript_16199/g.14538  ORF Transcript_16199/g.14538 Transcript_16199/m.14538 type:complete len:503 (-) Transcript_16199:135-1643(-)|eukprot:CAMPEP_0201568336 /NCGR_PEP_ID=MMETSP0190_2-20130828/9356_1 /ASSEMBLY_ACC=CAM_ASM_000263 /TAXON_ID=37353 /ORGANISM="Rosalina sp." /LENGTH=502 /DNA_ID=CAMNT_0047989327 /DNA_START=22 /DNA_END=1530 /DNA_ORIENTATION=+